MSTKITKLGKLDSDIAALRDRLEVKLSEREDILAELIAESEAIRAAVGLTAPAAPAPAPAPAEPFKLAPQNKLLTEAQVLDIRAKHAAGVSQSALGRQYGLSQPAIHNIVKRNTYKEVA